MLLSFLFSFHPFLSSMLPTILIERGAGPHCFFIDGKSRGNKSVRQAFELYWSGLTTIKCTVCICVYEYRWTIYHSCLRRQSAALDDLDMLAGDMVCCEAIRSCKFSNRGLSSTSNSRHSCTRQTLFSRAIGASVSLVHVANVGGGFLWSLSKSSSEQFHVFTREGRTLHGNQCRSMIGGFWIV